MRQSCKQCSTAFEVTDDDLALLKKLSPTIGGKTFDLPPPTLCFSCRLQRRLAFYNCRTLYRRTCDKTGKPIISVFSPDKPFTVYATDVWWSDEWNPMDYGRDVDFSRPMFPQIQELLQATPQIGLAILGDNINSDFTNDNYKTKNCYLIFDGERAEDCYYGHTFAGVRSCQDFVFLYETELCYECIHCQNCYGLKYCQYCTNCSESWFLRDCIGCKNCFGCVNLRQKQYCIFNEQKTKEEYEAFLSAFKTGSYAAVQAMKKQSEEFWKTQPVRATRGEQNIDCVGDNLSNSQNAYWCFDSLDKRDCRYCTDCMVFGADCMDIHIWGDGMELCYESCLVGAQARNVIGSYYLAFGVDGAYYSNWCSRQSANLFGCVGLRHKQYCILNKQYTKEEYETLVPKIIEHMQSTGEWGEFFPHAYSMFGYNETMAQSFFPMTRDDVVTRGWKWCDYEAPLDAKKTIDVSQLPDDIADVPDDILDWAIVCEISGKPFKIIKQELDFYRTHQLPLPRHHPDIRHRDRYAYKNPYFLWKRQCAKCSKEIETSYQPSRPEIVYCEECYLKAVY